MGGMPAGARRRQIQACPRGEQGQRCSIYTCRRRWGRAGERGARKKSGGLNEGWLWGGYSQVQGVGRPSEGRDGRRRELTCTDLRLEPILQPGDQRGQDVHAQENHLQQQTAGSRQRPTRGSAPSPASCRHAPASLAQTQPGSPSERRPEGEGGYQEEGRSCPKGRFTELTPESSARRYSNTDTASRLRTPAQEGGSSRRGPAPSGRAYANQLAAGA